MVLKHIPDDAGLFIIACPMLHAQRLCGGNLDMVEVPPVPERLEDRIGKPEHQDILNGFLGKVVVDAENLTFFIIGMDELVQLAC